MQRYRFLEIFRENLDGSLTNIKPINVNGATFNNCTFGAGVSFGGVNFHLYKYLDIAAEERNGILVIKGFYNK